MFNMLKILLVLSPKICCAMQHNGAPAPGPALIAYQTPGMICEHTGCERTDTCVHSFGCIALCAEHGPGQCVGTSEQDNCPVCEPEVEPEPEPTPEQQLILRRNRSRHAQQLKLQGCWQSERRCATCKKVCCNTGPCGK